MRYKVNDVLIKTDSRDLFTVTKVTESAIYVTWGNDKTGHFTRSTLDGYIRSGIYTVKSSRVELPEDLFKL